MRCAGVKVSAGAGLSPLKAARSGNRERAVLLNRPMRVVGDLPRVTVGVDEDPGIAAPERLGRLTADRAAGLAGLLDHLVDLVGRASVVGEGDAAPAAAVGHHAVLRELRSIPERDDHAAGLEENDVISLFGAGRPSQRLVEGAARARSEMPSVTRLSRCSIAISFPLMAAKLSPRRPRALN